MNYSRPILPFFSVFFTVFLHAWKNYQEEKESSFHRVPSKLSFLSIDLLDDIFGQSYMNQKVFPTEEKNKSKHNFKINRYFTSLSISNVIKFLSRKNSNVNET